MKIFSFILLFSLFIFSCHKGKNNPEACNGDTRREVKLLTDVLAPTVDTIPVLTTIAALGEMDVPEVKSETGRQTLELKTYTVTAEVDKVKNERDGDIHIRLKEGENYLITECPNPDCDYATGSAYVEIYRRIREFINSNDIEGKTVTITGVAFVDIDHHYKRKQAKNNIELHPILSISF
ncbi:hypothetical protein BH09BAC5_BH09BAC5_05960 [soil metagenome]